MKSSIYYQEFFPEQFNLISGFNLDIAVDTNRNTALQRRAIWILFPPYTSSPGRSHQPVIGGYGGTPSPCVMCNVHISQFFQIVNYLSKYERLPIINQNFPEALNQQPNSNVLNTRFQSLTLHFSFPRIASSW